MKPQLITYATALKIMGLPRTGHFRERWADPLGLRVVTIRGQLQARDFLYRSEIEAIPVAKIRAERRKRKGTKQRTPRLS